MKIITFIALTLITVASNAQFTDTVPDIVPNCLWSKDVDSLVVNFDNDSIYISGILQANCAGPWNLIRTINYDTIKLIATDDCGAFCYCPFYFNTIIPDLGAPTYRLIIGYKCSRYSTEQTYYDSTITYSTSNIHNNETSDFVKIYPNPITENCKIELVNTSKKILSVRVYDLTMKLVSHTGNKTALKRMSINLTGGISGVYFLQINTERNQYFKKIVKM
jgi:hypothetical protein